MTSGKEGTSLLINKEDSSDEEPLSEDQYDSEEDNNMTCEDQHSDGKDKDDTALDEDELSENESYVDNDMFSEDDYEGFAFVQDVTCNMNDKTEIPDRWILLVNQSTVDVFTNKKLPKIIYDVKQDIPMYCNAGMTTVNKIRDLPWYGMVWYFEDGIANILSLNNVKMVVLKCTKWMVPNVYLKNPKRRYST